MKTIILLATIFFSQLSYAQQINFEPQGEYGIHLFFNETEFIDVLTFSKNDKGELVGLMHVPNDFDGEITDFKINGLSISFNLFVPKNTARPDDLIFHYTGEFFDASQKQLKGFVTIEGKSDFVASYVGFKR